MEVVDLLERPLAALHPLDGTVSLEFRPFQIVTLRIRRGAVLEEENG